jgi:hypothetical protein
MRSLALAVGLVAATTLAPVQAEEIPGSQFESGYWTGAAHTDDRGAFSHCAVSVSYTGGELLWMGLYTNDTLAVLLSHPDIRFRPGETFDSWLMLETGLPSRGVSEAWDESFAGMTLEGIDASISFLTQGQWLRLLGIGIDDSYDVTGIGEALELARVCHARNSGSNPFAVVEPKPAGEPQPAEILDAPPVEAQPVEAQPAEAQPVEPGLGTPPPMPKVPDLRPKTGGVGAGGGLGTRPGSALGTPAPKPAP